LTTWARQWGSLPT